VTTNLGLDGLRQGVFEVDLELDVFDAGCSEFVWVAKNVKVGK